MAAAAVYEAPSVNSVRIQRAYRINTVEKGRLGQKLNTLEREKIRKLRLVNQDIRMVNLTLEFIQSSSGKSEEAMAPDDVMQEAEVVEEAPAFMYGERLNSRRFGKNRRSQSAFGGRRDSTDSTLSSSSSSTARPKSGPARMRGTFLTADSESVFSDYESDGERSRKSDRGFSNPMGLRAGRPAGSRPGSSRSSTRSSIPTSRLDGVQGFGRQSYVSGRMSRMPRHSFGGESARTSGDSAPAQNKQWASPALIGLNKTFHKNVLEYKRGINKGRADEVNDKLRSFLVKVPLKRF